ERALTHWADVAEEATRAAFRHRPGAGAAGGLAFGLLSFTRARCVPSFEILSRLVGLGDRIRDCDVLITGEGQFDAQTGFGKGPLRLARAARALGKPAVLFAGSVREDAAELRA